MSLEKYTIGGDVVPVETSEAFADIPQNRVLLAEKLTVAAPTRPEVIEGLTTVEEVFAHFKPEIEMEFETEEGTSKKEVLRFQNLGDFGIKGITAQSAFLAELTMKREKFKKMIKQLKSNKLLKKALVEHQNKESLINALQVLIEELKNAK